MERIGFLNMKSWKKLFAFLAAFGIAALIGGENGDKTFFYCYIGVVTAMCLMTIIIGIIDSCINRDAEHVAIAIVRAFVTMIFYLGLGMLITLLLASILNSLTWNVSQLSFFTVFKLYMLCQIPFESKE